MNVHSSEELTTKRQDFPFDVVLTNLGNKSITEKNPFLSPIKFPLEFISNHLNNFIFGIKNCNLDCALWIGSVKLKMV